MEERVTSGHTFPKISRHSSKCKGQMRFIEQPIPICLSQNGWLSTCHTLLKLAKLSGKVLFKSTHFRKHILQIMNITKCKMEQFTNFMGDTKKTHENLQVVSHYTHIFCPIFIKL